MKKFTVVAIILLLCVGMTFAQDTKAKTSQGDKAWLFTWGGLSTMTTGYYANLATINGTIPIVGARYYFKDNMALRLGVGFQSNGELVVNNVSGKRESKSSTAFGLFAGVQYDYTVNGPVAAYLGGQLMYGSFKPADRRGSGLDAFTSMDAASTFGIGAFTGVEWFPWSQLSLAPEVQLNFISTSQGKAVDPANPATTYDLPAVTNFGLSTAGTLTLSIYF